MAALAFLGIASSTFLLRLAIPARPVEGYVLDERTGLPLTYKNNGLLVLASVVALSAAAHCTGLVDGAILHDEYWGLLRASCASGLLASAFMLRRGQAALAAGRVSRAAMAPTVTSGLVQPSQQDFSEFEGRSQLEHFYCGIEFNPRLAGVDLKMWLYVQGACTLQLLLLSGLVAHLRHSGAWLPSRAFGAYFVCLSWFCVEYLYYEDVHAFTYDLFRERLGFKLLWGCLCFYPCFYALGMWSLVEAPGWLPAPEAGFCVALFFAGWVLTRGANLQKHAFRRDPASRHFTFCGCIRVQQRCIDPDTAAGRKVLCSGWWGLARHVNYLGEILQAVALALPGFLAAGTLQPLLYPTYYVLLFLGRQRDDDIICAQKYGEAWERYERLVPSRIIPGIF